MELTDIHCKDKDSQTLYISQDYTKYYLFSLL